MMWTLSLALMALSLGGILSNFGFLRVLIAGILSRIKATISLVAATIIGSIAGNITMGDAYMSIILGGQLFGDAYDKHNIDRSVMSRSLEEGATLTTVLISIRSLTSLNLINSLSRNIPNVTEDPLLPLINLTAFSIFIPRIILLITI